MSLKRNSDLTAARLRQVILYYPGSGKFVWRSTGNIAGSRETGRRPILRITVDGTKYVASRLAWLYVRGVWPRGDLDHKDTDCKNDRFNNLREASKRQNCYNKSVRADSLTGAKGVSLINGTLIVRISVKGERLYLGRPQTISEGAKMYRSAAKRLHGEFARA